MRSSMTLLLISVLAAAVLSAAAGIASASGLSATVRKESVTAHARPDFDAPALATFTRGDAVRIAGQDGLWYELALDGGAPGYVRVNEVRVADSTNAAESGEAMHVLLSGKSSRGRVSETAGVRGLDESELRSAAFDAAALAAMESHRASPQAAAAYARRQGWSSTQVAWQGEAGPVGGTVEKSQVHEGTSAARGLFGSFGGVLDTVMDVVDKTAPESETALLETELELGPLIAGRVLGARPLWDDAQAQQRVNMIGRWLASQTSRPDLPWTFGVIDSPEVNAFAAPGGYVLVTRGLYELVANDAELAGVLAHEITHVVQRDHYAVIRDQGLLSTGLELVGDHIDTGGGVAGRIARDYVEKHGASILATSLDREAEYRADAIAQVYLARAGSNPLAMYALLQKMAAVATPTGGLAQLYATHPSIDDRLDRVDRRGYGVLAPYLDRPVTAR